MVGFVAQYGFRVLRDYVGDNRYWGLKMGPIWGHGLKRKEFGGKCPRVWRFLRTGAVYEGGE